MSSESRPDRTTMEGMIWNANHVLDIALDPATPGIPRGMIKNCKGILLLSVVEAGFVFSGNVRVDFLMIESTVNSYCTYPKLLSPHQVGTGVVIANKYDGTWSAPSAIGLGGIGFGFMVGAEVKDIVMCVMDDTTLDTLSVSNLCIDT